MVPFFQNINVQLLLWLNQALMHRTGLYPAVLQIANQGGELVTAIAFSYLWYWRAPHAKHLLVAVNAAGQPKSRYLRLVSAGRFQRFPSRSKSRLESRAQAIALGVAGASAYVTARLLTLNLHTTRPFASGLNIWGPPGVFGGLRHSGSFPCDHAVLLGLLLVGVTFWSRKSVLLTLPAALVCIASRCAVGFHYPSDMLAGALLGAIHALAVMHLYEKGVLGRKRWLSVASCFDPAAPALCLASYSFLTLVGIEFSMHFQHIFDFIFWFQGGLSNSLGSAHH